MRFALLGLILVTTSTAHAGQGAFLPPLEVDIGIGAPVGPAVETVGPSTELLVGLHWASLYWKPTRFDVGVGYVGSFREVDQRGVRNDHLEMHGGYFTLGTTLVDEKHWRTWFAARGELLRATDGARTLSATGMALRVSTEVFTHVHDGHRGAVVGTLGIGIYAEATYRSVPDRFGPHGFTTGVSIRLPLVVAGG